MDVLIPTVKPLEWIDLPTGDEASFKSGLAALKLPQFDLKTLDGEFPRYQQIDHATALLLKFHAGTTTESVFILFNQNGVLTVRGARVDWPELRLQWEQTSAGGEPAIFALVVDLMLAAIFSFELSLDDIEDQDQALEARVFENQDVPEVLQTIYAIKRRLARINRTHRLLIDVIGKLAIRWPEQRPRLQTAADEAEMSLQFSDRLLDNLHQLVSVQLSLASHRTNEIVRLLTLFSVIFMPLTFIAGIYGMNFHHMPELEWTYGYPAVLGLMASVAAFSWWWFRRKGWVT